MILESLVVGPLGVNCYILGDEQSRAGIVIDPGGNARDILNTLERHRLKVGVIVNTHAHFDHVLALEEIRSATGAPFVLHEDDLRLYSAAQASAAMFGLNIPQPAPPDRLVRDGDEVSVTGITLKVLHTPGHSPGGICLLQEKNLFAGDTLFQGSIGRTDLPGGDYGILMGSIRDKLFPLPDDTNVYPGHGPATRMRDEKAWNPFLQPLITGQWTV